MGNSRYLMLADTVSRALRLSVARSSSLHERSDMRRESPGYRFAHPGYAVPEL